MKKLARYALSNKCKTNVRQNIKIEFFEEANKQGSQKKIKNIKVR